MPDDWQRCTRMVNGRYSLTGIHAWRLLYVDGLNGKKKAREVRCHFCNEEPPRIHRARMVEEMLRYEAEEKARRARQRKLRDVMKGPA